MSKLAKSDVKAKKNVNGTHTIRKLNFAFIGKLALRSVKTLISFLVNQNVLIVIMHLMILNLIIHINVTRLECV